MRGGPKHGPYYARYWWQDGRRWKQYVRQQDAADVAVACSARRVSERNERDRAEEARQAWRDIRALLREIEHAER
jgi:FPC/CPF motif-containing protein YcgG